MNASANGKIVELVDRHIAIVERDGRRTTKELPGYGYPGGEGTGGRYTNRISDGV
jgi:hypothetical protein